MFILHAFLLRKEDRQAMEKENNTISFVCHGCDGFKDLFFKKYAKSGSCISRIFDFE